MSRKAKGCEAKFGLHVCHMICTFAKNNEKLAKMAIFGQILVRKMRFFPETYLCLELASKCITYPKSIPNGPNLAILWSKNPQNGPKMAIFGPILVQKIKIFLET